MFNKMLPISNTISVEGISEISAIPDIVSIYFNVETTGDNAQEAKDSNAEIVNTATNSIMSLGFKEEEITTENFNIYQDYSWENGKRKDNGYKATHTLKIKLGNDKLSEAGKVIDAGVNSGANINYINFELSLEKQNELKAEALSLATVDAKIKAEAIASGLEKKLGKLISVSDSSFNYYPWPLLGVREDTISIAEAKQVTTDIQPSEQTISARISVVYKI